MKNDLQGSKYSRIAAASPLAFVRKLSSQLLPCPVRPPILLLRTVRLGKAVVSRLCMPMRQTSAARTLSNLSVPKSSFAVSMADTSKEPKIGLGALSTNALSTSSRHVRTISPTKYSENSAAEGKASSGAAAKLRRRVTVFVQFCLPIAHAAATTARDGRWCSAVRAAVAALITVSASSFPEVNLPFS